MTYLRVSFSHCSYFYDNDDFDDDDWTMMIDFDDMIRHLEHELIAYIKMNVQKFGQWFHQNTLKLNIDKTKFIKISNNIKDINEIYQQQIVTDSEDMILLGLKLGLGAMKNGQSDRLMLCLQSNS